MAQFTRKTGGGTSFHGTEIKATVKELKTLFPNSFDEHNDGTDKTNFDFVLETDDKRVFTIYDWKEYRKLKMNETIDWHIGGADESTTLQGAIEVNKLLAKLRK